jgi:hypothetical protein
MTTELETFLRGAEGFWHRAQTYLSAWTRVAIASFAAASLVFGVVFFAITNALQRTVTTAYIKAHLWAIVNQAAAVNLQTPDGQRHTMSASDMIELTAPAIHRQIYILILPMMFGAVVAVIACRSIARKYHERGLAATENTFLRGQQLATDLAVAALTSPH